MAGCFAQDIVSGYLYGGPRLEGLENRKPKKKILVVEDIAVVRMVIEKILQQAGYNVACVENGEEALLYLKLEKIQPDLIVMDVAMPKMDGLTALKHIRDDEKTKNMSVIMCTAKSDMTDIVKAASLRVDGYIVKPFKAEVLQAKVLEVLHNTEKQLVKQA